MPARDALRRSTVQPMFMVMPLASAVCFGPAVQRDRGQGGGRMSRAHWRSKGLAYVAALTALALVTAESAVADPCADACRSQHNACRMNAKLLFSPRCDAALQGCISGCFAQGRFDRGRERGHKPHDLRAAPESRGPPAFRTIPQFRGPPEFHGPEGFRGPRGFGRGDRH